MKYVFLESHCMGIHCTYKAGSYSVSDSHKKKNCDQNRKCKNVRHELSYINEKFENNS